VINLLSPSPIAKTIILKNSGIKTCVRLLSYSAFDVFESRWNEDLALTSTSALINLIKEGEESVISSLVDEGGLGPLVAMASGDAGEIRKLAISALHIVSELNNGNQCPLQRRELCNAGCVEAFVSVLNNNNGADDDVLLCAVTALANMLVRCSDEDENEVGSANSSISVAERIVVSGGLKVLLALSKNFDQKQMPFHLQVMRALANLCPLVLSVAGRGKGLNKGAVVFSLLDR